MQYLCYIDEAGNADPLDKSNTDKQPLLVIAGLILHQEALPDITREFLSLKRKYFPGSFNSPHLLDDVRQEIKGTDLRGAIRKKAHNAKTELRFVDETLELLEKYECRILADIWIKGVAVAFKERETYTRSIQQACRSFQAFLEGKDAKGFMVADFRTPTLNDRVAHSIFTQKYRAKGDPFGRILELPTFGVSNNHVGLQITDVLCTALLFPMASSVYCFGHVTGVHVNARDLVIRRRYSKRLKNLQFKPNGAWSIWVSDRHKKRSSADLFVVPPMAAKPRVQAQPAAKVAVEPAKQGTPMGTLGAALKAALDKSTIRAADPVQPGVSPGGAQPLAES